MRISSFIRFVLSGLLISSTALAAPSAQGISQQPPGVSGVIPPNVMWALSVEFPTAGEAYNNRTIEDLASLQNKYIGYFDPDKCYDYSGSGTANGYFYPVAAVNNATNRTCANSKWSGNLLNWATMTAVDVFRSTLTGGNRALGNSGASAEYAAGDTATTSSATGVTYLRRARVYAGQNQGYGFSPPTIGKKSKWTTAPARKLANVINTNLLTPYDNTALYFSSTDWTFSVYRDADSLPLTFNAVVKVCDSSIRLESNCNTYNNGGRITYKPEGLIQKNAAQMRFGVMSYLNDSDYNRDGGVLRARMKSTGSAASATSTSGNSYALGAEWSSSNGTFVTNPDTTDATGSTVTNSGVANMINKFGDASGYKTYDPGAELYYAALRYYRKLGNYAPYTNNLTTAMKDNFPVITDWDDPITNSCQKNFIIYIGDTNTHGDVDLPGTSWTVGGNQTSIRPPTDDTAFNVTTLLNTMGVTTGNTGSTNSPPYIAALAYWANTSTIRSDYPAARVKAFTIDTVENGGAKSETTNAFYLAAKWGGFTDANNSNTPDQNSEWRDTSRTISDYPSGVPQNFAQANNPSAMVTALTNAINNVTQNSRQTVVTPTVNGGSVRPDGNTMVYVPSFNANNWTGDLQAFSIDASSVIASTASWSAQSNLEAALNNTGGVSARNVFTYNASNRTGSLFNSSQSWLVNALNRDPSGTADSYGTQRINYMRGDKSSESAAPFFRPRTARLGDIINSSPVYIPAPTGQPADCSFTTDSTTLSSIKGRSPMVAVGSNDGMLHLFNASDGSEILSYVPGSILSKLPNLMNSIFTHQYYVDGPALAANVCIGGIAKTVLTGSTGAGGKGIFALDVTRASDSNSGGGFSASNVLWEFTSADDANLGVTIAQPQLVKLRNGLDSNNKPLYKYALITGNGLNNTASSPKASLFVLYMDGPGTSGWVLNTHYRRLDAGAADTSSNSTDIAPNGLMSPASADTDGDGITDYIYAGDINGNLWKFDLTNADPAQWSVTKDAQSTPQPKPFFSAYSVATVSGSLVNQVKQPIVAPPQIIKHPAGGLMLLFGTGKLFDSVALGSQYLYGLRDKLDGSSLSTTAGSTLQAQSLNSSTVNGSGNNSNTLYQGSSSSNIDYSTQNGWYMPLQAPTSSQSAERVLAPAAIRQGRVQFTSLIPSSDPCLAGGDTWLTELKPFSGGQFPVPIFDTNGDGKVNGSDSRVSRQKISGLSGGMLNLSAGQFSTLRLGSDLKANISESRQPMRISWREIISTNQ